MIPLSGLSYTPISTYYLAYSTPSAKSSPKPSKPKRATGKTLYLIDEPTTGLSFYDVHKLLDVLQRLVDKGNSVIAIGQSPHSVIEHNLDVIRCSDWTIDLGPEGGNKGGELVAVGTPEQVAKNPKSHTGKYLKQVLKQHSTAVKT
jgi:excinuclease ABC subunit A